MGETRRKFDRDFKEGAVRLVRETGKPIAQVARDLGINAGTLGNWVEADRRRREGGDGRLSEGERAELARLRRENAELAMRCDVLKRSVALWFPTRWAAGSRGRVHRFPEGRSRRPARGVLPGARSVPVLVLQVEGRSAAAAGRAAGAAENRGRAAVRGARGEGRGAADHRRAARGGLDGEREHCRGPDARAGPGRPPRPEGPQGHDPAGERPAVR
jgi:transposase